MAVPDASPSFPESETTPLLTATSPAPPAASNLHPTPQPQHAIDPPSYSPPSTPRVRFATSTPTPTLPPYSAARYGNYASEAEYLSALRAWVADKDVIDAGDKGLVGFYGKTTMEGYIERAGGGARSRRDKAGDKEGKGGRGKGRGEGRVGGRARARGDNAGADGNGAGDGNGDGKGEEPKAERRRSGLGGWLARKRAKRVGGA